MNRLFILLAVCLLALIAVSAVEVDVSVRIGGGHNHHDSEPVVHELSDAAGEESPDAQTEGPAVPIVGAGAPDFSSIESIKQLAGSSSCAKINWNNRGRAPAGYIKGVALTWAKAVCNPTRPDVLAVGAAVTRNVRKDALAQYASAFRAAGMDNSVSGLDTARHAYTLLIGLGMRESSGKHCCGRDMSAHFTKSETAEAGVFQTSYGSRATNNILEPMFQKYANNQGGNCFLDTFKEGAKCGTNDWKNWGTGNGAQWQTLTKQCPAFATEWGSALLRTNGGSAGEWGPLRRREAQLKPECDSMLKQVQTIVQQHPNLCNQLN